MKTPPPPINSDGFDSETYCLLSVVFLAFVVRLIRLGTFAFWYDEAYSLLVSQDLYGAVVHGELIASHPPLSYVLLALWQFVGMGYNEWTMRGLPLLFGMLGVVALYWFTKHLFNGKVAVVAALLLAVSPFHVLHSQEIKEHIYLPFFATMMAGFFYRAVSDNKGRDWFLYGLFAGVCCYAGAFAAPLLVAVNLWFLAQWPSVRSRCKGWLLSNIFGALLFLPWLGIMLSRIYHFYIVTEEHWYILPPDIWSVVFYFKTIAFGYSAAKPYFYLAFLLFALAALAGVFSGLRQNRRGASLLVCWTVIPVVLTFALSYTGRSLFLIRAMLPYSIAVYVLVAVGIVSIPLPRIRALSLTMLIVLCAVGLHGYFQRDYHPLQHPHRPGTHPPRAYDEAAAHILERLEEGDLVAHASMSTWAPFHWYGFHRYPHYVAGCNEHFNELIISSLPVTTTYEDYLRLWPDVIENIVDGNPRIWYVFSEWERAFLEGNAMAVYRWLDSRYVEVDHTAFKGIDIYLYLTPDHADIPAILERDMDNGAVATLRYSTLDTPYRKVFPDAGLIEAPPEKRKGNLELRFDADGGPAANSPVIAFSIENTGDDDAVCDVFCLESSLLLPFAAFTRVVPTDSAWNYWGYWNCEPPPQLYDLAVLAGNFDNGSSSVAATVSLNSGTYHPYVYSLFPWNHPEWIRADIRITANDKLLFDDGSNPILEAPRWKWARGNAFTLDAATSVDIVVEGKAFDDSPEVYGHLGYIAFVDDHLLPGNAQNSQVLAEWPGEVTIPSGESMRWEREMSPFAGRVDVWAFERGDDGKAYHIFRLFPERPGGN